MPVGAGHRGSETGRRGLERAAALGAMAGVATALADYGALWLWLPTWELRADVFVRMLALQAAAGLLAGSLLGLGVATGRRLPTRLRPLPLVALATPALGHVAWALFQGGAMRRLPHREILVGLTFAAGLAGAWGAARLGAWLWTLRGRRRRVAAGAGALLFVAITKIDQLVLPKLYEYLHGLLTAGAWLSAAATLALLLREPRLSLLRAALAPFPRRALLAATALAAAITVATLPSAPNARVALHDARASNSHSLMLALEPALAAAGPRRDVDRAIARARARARRVAQPVDGLPQLPEAHVLLVTIDALRADHLGVYGYERGVSPNLDAFAREALVFDHAYAAAPHSSFSLSSLWTSSYIHQLVELRRPLPTTTLASRLRDAGYHTAAFYTRGIFHTEGERMAAYDRDAFGFARHEHADLAAEPLTDRALEELDRVVAAGEPPTLLWVHYFDVHEPYRETALGTSDVDRYDGELRNVDRAFGRLLEGVRDRLGRSVLVAVTADHGEEFRDHGGVYHGSTLYEEQIRVPLLLQVPGVRPRRVQAPVELVDLAPTLAGLVDHPWRPTGGDDLRPLFDADLPWSPAFAAVSHKKMVVRWPHKLVANLRFDLFEVYDLQADPRERVNLAGERPELLGELKGEIYAWLDGLQGGEDPHEAALALGRLRDRRAVEPLCELLRDERAPQERRVEAARLLARLAAPRSAPALVEVMTEASDPLVRAEAAVALGRQYDPRAQGALRRLVHSEDPDLRSRAAVSLGRLRDPEAVPALIDALHVSRDAYEREEAVRWLGRLRDPRALDPLLELLADFRVRHLTVVALGHLGDPRAFAPLAQALQWETHQHIRDGIARALGQLGDPRATPLLVSVAYREPELRYPPESLVRLGALEARVIGGIDADRRLARQRGVGECREGPPLHDWDYLARTTCTTRGSTVQLPIRTPRVAGEVLVALRARRVDAAEPARVGLLLDEERHEATFDGEWSTAHIHLPRAPERARLELPEGVELEIDHLLVIPAAASLAATAPTDAPAQET